MQNDLVTAMALASSALQTALIANFRQSGLISDADISKISQEAIATLARQEAQSEGWAKSFDLARAIVSAKTHAE